MFAGKLAEMFNSLSSLRSFTMSRGPASAAFLKSSATENQLIKTPITGNKFLTMSRYEQIFHYSEISIFHCFNVEREKHKILHRRSIISNYFSVNKFGKYIAIFRCICNFNVVLTKFIKA